MGRAVAFWLIWTPFTVCIALAFTDLTHFNVSALIPSLAPHGLPRPLSVVIGALAAALVGDFFYYWCHRAQHRFFWRFHAVHHAVREMSGVAAYHHVTEEAFKLALYTVSCSPSSPPIPMRCRCSAPSWGCTATTCTLADPAGTSARWGG